MCSRSARSGRAGQQHRRSCCRPARSFGLRYEGGAAPSPALRGRTWEVRGRARWAPGASGGGGGGWGGGGGGGGGRGGLRGGGAGGRWGNEGRGVTRQPGGSYAKAGQRRPGRLKPAQNLYVWSVLSWNGRSSRLMKCTMFWLRISDTLNCRCRIMCRDWPSLWKDDIAQQNLRPKLLFWMSRLSVLDNSLDNSASRSLSKALHFETGHRHPSFGDGAALPSV